MNYSDYQFKYDLYLASTVQNQNDIIRYTSECACLEAGDLRGIQSLNESVVDGIKSAIQKIIAAIGTIWKKFVEKANELLSTDASYLEKYKSIILSKPPKSKEITMYQYNHDTLKNVIVPQFTYDEKMKKWLASDKPEDEFATTFLSATKLNENAELKEALQELFRGGDQVDVDGKNLDMKKMYEFCANYKATVELIKKDTDTIAKSQGEVNKVIGQLAPKIDAADKAAQAQKTNNSSNGQNTNNQNTNNGGGQSIDAGSAFDKSDATATGESAYSVVYGTYITEDQNIKIGGTKDEPKTATPSDASTKGAQVNNGVGKGIVTKDTTAAMGNDLAAKDKEDFDKISTNAPIFFRCSGNILAAKLTVCQEIQKTYMAIIRAHVRDYVGETK